MNDDAMDTVVPEWVLVVVVTFNSVNVLPALLRSLPDAMAGVSWRLVVTDNDSADDSIAVTRQLAPDARVVQSPRNAGYAAGINAAVASADPGSAAILVLNPDVRLTPGCVLALLGTIREPGVGIAVPRLSDGNGDLILSMRREPTVLRALGDAFLGAERAGHFAALGEVVSTRSAYDAPAVVDWAEGSTQLISAACWSRCGPWDESYFLYSEEADFDLRARDASFAVRYEPRARATHLKGGSSTTPGLWRLLVLNRVRLYRRRHGLIQSVPFWAATFLRELSRGLLGWETSRKAAWAMVSPRRWRESPGPEAVRS